VHIAVDGSSWGGQERGVAVATRRLWFAFLEAASLGHVTTFAPQSCARFMSTGSFFAVGPLSGMRKFVWQQIQLPPLLRSRHVDLLFCPCYTIPIGGNCRTVVSVHDLIALSHWNLVGWKNAVHFRITLGRSIKQADAVCVPTEFVRSQIIARFGVPKKKVFVVPWGVNSEIERTPRSEAEIKIWTRFGIDRPFVLFCGCIEAKKNVEAAIRGCAMAGLPLVVAGPWISSSHAIVSRLEPSLSRCWRYVGYVSTGELSALYSAAIALVVTSHSEGFGLPAVEAMRCGCPVIATDAPAVREVCRGAAIHVDARDPVQLACTLRELVGSPSFRSELSLRGLARAKELTWRRAAASFSEAVAFANRW